ncbi:MAG: undecaprenyldiphospho-muramoylpentapeptide beta-N-acetylglucosaminyltransferase [Thermoanaerobaculia bacterium]
MSELGAFVIAAGGTGGHVVPGIALAHEIRSQKHGSLVVFIGTSAGLESKLVPQAGFPLELVDAAGFVGKTIGRQIGALAKVPKGFLEARALLKKYRARVVIGVGGYVTVPVLTAARSLGIPTLIHESNAIPGVANKFLSKFATATAVGLPEVNNYFKKPGVVIGTPVRSEFFAIPPIDPAATTRRVLVFGGSQGSRVMNRGMARAGVLLEKSGIEVIHQTGDQDLVATRQRYTRVPANWKLVPFLPKLWEEMAWADLVVCRAGAMTVAELAAAGRPSILVPFVGGGNHQIYNAKALYQRGAAALMEERNLTAENLAGAITEKLKDREKLVLMGQKAKALAKPDAVNQLAKLVFSLEERR